MMTEDHRDLAQRTLQDPHPVPAVAHRLAEAVLELTEESPPKTTPVQTIAVRIRQRDEVLEGYMERPVWDALSAGKPVQSFTLRRYADSEPEVVVRWWDCAHIKRSR